MLLLKLTSYIHLQILYAYINISVKSFMFHIILCFQPFFVERVFHIFDKDESGSISFQVRYNNFKHLNIKEAYSWGGRGGGLAKRVASCLPPPDILPLKFSRINRGKSEKEV